MEGQAAIRYCARWSAGANIDPQTGNLTWRPRPEQAPASMILTVSVETADGRHDKTSFVVNVLSRFPLAATSHGPQTVEAGKQLIVAVSPENPATWHGKVRFSLGSQCPAGREIDPQTGEFSWTPPLAEPAGQVGNQRFRPGARRARQRQQRFQITVTGRLRRRRKSPWTWAAA